MSRKHVGISDIEVFVPPQSISLEDIIQERLKSEKIWERKLRRAVMVTGQKSLRFPTEWEDTTTMAAQAFLGLSERMDEDTRQKVRYLTIGTETGVDHSKPASSYVLGMMAKAGRPLPPNLTTFQVQHACAGGTLGMLSIAGLLGTSGQRGDSGVVLTSDVARYEAPSTAEITQGAGATALLIQRDPDLISINLEGLGLFSSDVDDFFRPLNSITAKVKGGYSVQCYNESLLGAFEDHCSRIGVNPADELRSVDIFALHVPYSKMPLTALHKLFEKHLEFTPEETDEYLESKGFFASTAPTQVVGNIYTGSLYLGLAFSLKERYASLGRKIIGKKILMASYGSGNTMALFTGEVCRRAPEVIDRWDLEAILNGGTNAPFSEYQNWLDHSKQPVGFTVNGHESSIPQGRFYLERIREDGYRGYNYR